MITELKAAIGEYDELAAKATRIQAQIKDFESSAASPEEKATRLALLQEQVIYVEKRRAELLAAMPKLLGAGWHELTAKTSAARAARFEQVRQEMAAHISDPKEAGRLAAESKGVRDCDAAHQHAIDSYAYSDISQCPELARRMVAQFEETE